MSHAIGGERVAALLPLLLRPGALGKMPKKQRERIRRETGGSKMLPMVHAWLLALPVCRSVPTALADCCNRVPYLHWHWTYHLVTSSCLSGSGLNNLGDVQKLIELMPRPLAQYLRCANPQLLVKQCSRLHSLA